MEVLFAEHELHNACQVLFGSELQTSRGFLEYLQLSGIKSAYRQKVLETHPDRCISSTNQNCTDLFMSVQHAYENLCSYVNARAQGHSLIISKTSPINNTASHPPAPGKGSTTKRRHSQSNRQQRQKATGKASKNNIHRTRSSTARIYTGPMPKRKLLFGHYLYYSGLASWQTITKALVWQRTKRPRIGELGCRLGWLNSKDIITILKNKQRSTAFGTSALDLGLLTHTQLNLLVLQQKRLQKKFGEYFIDNNLLSARQIEHLVQQFHNHNYSTISLRSGCKA